MSIVVAREPVDLARLEAVKWLAFVAMVCDHVDLVLFARSVPWLHLIGGFAFPVFCICFGLGLASSRDPAQAGLRLLFPAVLAQLAWLAVDLSHQVNVLAMFALCAVAVRLTLLAPLVLGLAAYVGEGGIFLPAMVAAGFFAGRVGSLVPILAGGLSWAVLAGSAGGFVATAALAWWPSTWRTWPRVPGLLAWGYAVHLALLAAIKALSS